MAIYKKISIFQGGGSSGGSDDKRVKVSSDDAQSGFLEQKVSSGSNKVDISTANPASNELLKIDINEENIDHDALLNYDATEHAPLDDSSTTTTSLWSSQKTQDELDNKIDKVSSTDNALSKFDGTEGQLQDTGIIIDDSNNVTGINDLTVDGNLTVNGTTTTVNTDILDVEDANITINKNGNQTTAEGAGITVEITDGTDASIVYDSSLESKFKVGEVGSESEIVTVDTNQTLSNKDIDANNNTISNIDTTNLEAGVLSTDLSVAGSDLELASSLAIQNYVDSTVTDLETLIQDSIDAVEDYSPNKTFYVDVNGDDLNIGSIHKPFKTIQAAIDAVTEQGSLIHVNNGVYNEDLVLAGKYNLVITTEGNTDSNLTYILGTINLVDSESVRFRNFGIQKNTTDPIIKFGEVAPVAPVSGSSRHYFESCAITNLSGGTVIEMGDGVTEFMVFRSCALIGTVDMSDITSTGSSLSLISCSSEGSNIIVGANQTLLASQCISVGNILHTNGVVYLKDIDFLQKDGSGNSLVSTASFSPVNFIYLEDVNLYDGVTQTYGKLTIPATAFVLNLTSRGDADVLNEALRITRGQKAIDHAYDNSISGLTANNVQAAIDEVEDRLDVVESSISSGSSNLQAHLDDTTDAHDASAISYDNTSSGFTAINVQAAIDEENSRAIAVENDLQDAIDALEGSIGTVVGDIFQVMNEPTGFSDITTSTVTFDDLTYTLTIAPVSGSFEFYVRGTKYTKSSAESIQIDNTLSGNHYFYYDEDGVLSTTQVLSQNLFTQNALVSIVYWNPEINAHIYFAEERHGLQMDGATHGYLHTTFGARYLSGHALENFTIGNGSLDSHAQFTADGGTIRDEDLVLQSLAQSQIPILYKQGSLWRKKAADSFPMIYSGTAGYSGTNIPYNEFNGISWVLTEASNNEFVLVHFFATNDKDNPIVGVQGINSYNNGPEAKDAASVEISQLTGIPFVEFVAIGTVLLETSSSYGNTAKAKVEPINSANYIDFRGTQLYTPAGEATTHSLLSGLLNDDHLQYHTDARADIWYESKISAGDIQETTTVLLQNQSDTNVTNLVFDPLVVRSFVADISVEIGADSNLYERFTIQGIYKDSEFDYSIESQGDDSSIIFSIDNNGQIKYNSGTYAGFTQGLIKFRAITTSI